MNSQGRILRPSEPRLPHDSREFLEMFMTNHNLIAQNGAAFNDSYDDSFHLEQIAGETVPVSTQALLGFHIYNLNIASGATSTKMSPRMRRTGEGFVEPATMVLPERARKKKYK